MMFLLGNIPGVYISRLGGSFRSPTQGLKKKTRTKRAFIAKPRREADRRAGSSAVAC